MTATSDKNARPPRNSTTGLCFARFIAAAALILSIALVRVVYPGSDAYARLTWSSALLTDEGFYIHNARNLVLFGHMRTDEFNNALIMPLLHLVQVLVFRIWGVGAMQARSISIGASLLTLLVLWDALRRVWSLRCAWLSVLLLGLDPAFALYNRLALMDTPACLPLCLAFWLWTLAQAAGSRQQDGKRAGCLFLCGLFLGLAYCVRGLTAVIAPVPMLLLAQQAWRQHKQATRNKEQPPVTRRGDLPHLLISSSALLFLLALVAGLGLVLLAYVVCWYLPNRTEMAHVNRFYLHEQLLPRSIAQFGRNLWIAVSHRHCGVLPFLLKHSPVLLLLSGYWLIKRLSCLYNLYRGIRHKAHMTKPDVIVSTVSGFANESGETEICHIAPVSDSTTGLILDAVGRSQCAYFVAGWLLVLLAFVSVVDYSPSRYYVMFYPALAGLAAIALEDMLNAAGSIQERQTRRFLALLSVVWMCLNGYWYADWIGHITYRQQAADQWLAAHLPSDSVLLGAVSPGLCLNNHFKCVVMIDNLCNYHAPVEKFATAPRYVVILDTDSDVEPNLRLPSQRLWANRWKEKWWLRHYPSVVRHENRLYAFPHMLRHYFTVGIYPVPVGYRPEKPHNPRRKIRIRPYWRDSVSSRENIQSEILLEH